MEMSKLTGTINPRDLNKKTYVEYCRLYLTEKIYEQIPATCPLKYNHVSRLINCINPIMFDNLTVETNKILLLNKIYSLFMVTDVELYRPFLYELIMHISGYNPELYKKSEKKVIDEAWKKLLNESI